MANFWKELMQPFVYSAGVYLCGLNPYFEVVYSPSRISDVMSYVICHAYVLLVLNFCTG
jgi:hypothetical protein